MIETQMSYVPCFICMLYAFYMHVICMLYAFYMHVLYTLLQFLLLPSMYKSRACIFQASCMLPCFPCFCASVLPYHSLNILRVCTMPYAVCHMHYTICSMPYAVCSMPYTYALYGMWFTLSFGFLIYFDMLQ